MSKQLELEVPVDIQRLPPGWTAAVFERLTSLSQNGLSARRGEGRPTVVLRLADVDAAAGVVRTEGLREIPLPPEKRERYALLTDDLLAVRVNGSPSIAGSMIRFPGPDGHLFCDHFIRFRLYDGLHPQFVTWAFRHGPVRKQVEAEMVSSAGQHTVSQRTYSKICLPLPPLPEQRRIVAEIEKQFTRLDAAVANLERVKANLKRARASVLKAAVEGRLVPTEASLAQAEGRDYEPASVLLERILEERERKHEEAQEGAKRKKKYKPPVEPDTEGLPELPEGWAWVTLDGLASVTGGITKNKKLTDGREVPYLRVANVQRGRLDLAAVKTILAPEDKIEKLRLLPGDILLNEGGDRDKLGRGWIWEGQLEECIHQNHVFRARVHGDNVLPKYVSHYANGVGQSYFIGTGKQTTNLASISLSNIKALPVALPPRIEQVRILGEVERRLSVLDALDESVGLNLARCNRLRQSILKRAFEGKLVPQDPNDEPASELLARIQAEAEAAKPKRTKKKAAKKNPKRVSRHK